MCFETSALTNYGMEDMMYEIASEIHAHKDIFEKMLEHRTSSVGLKKGQKNGEGLNDAHDTSVMNTGDKSVIRSKVQ